jgi:ATP-binding cassette subfamily C protein
LSDGYDTQIGEAGAVLSAGQRQRVGLARALFKDPFLVVLDEPNSNLDTQGEQALARAIRNLRARKAIVVVIAHRPSVLVGIDLVLTMVNGRAIDFGPRDEVLKRSMQLSNTVTPQRQNVAGSVGAVPLRVIGDATGSSPQ